MSIDIQLKIKNNPYYIRYIRENSEWYRILNRHPNSFKTFEQEVLNAYKLRPVDKISKALDTINLVQNVLTTLK